MRLGGTANRDAARLVKRLVEGAVRIQTLDGGNLSDVAVEFGGYPPLDHDLMVRLHGDGGRPVVGGTRQVDDAAGPEGRVEQAAAGRGEVVLQCFQAWAEADGPGRGLAAGLAEEAEQHGSVLLA